MCRCFFGEFITVEEAGVECGYAHHGCCFGKFRQYIINVKAGQEDHCTTGQQRYIGCYKEAVGMEYGECMKERVLFCKLPVFDQALSI